MKKLTLFLILLMATSMGFAQNNPIDFEPDGIGADWTWTVFENDTNPDVEIIANPDPTGINTSATVAKITALQTGNPWAGTESAHGSDLGSFVLDETNSTVSIMVWKSVISDVGIKFAAPGGWGQVEIKVPNTKVNEWEELVFDFSAYVNPPASEGQLGQIIVFPDFDMDGRTQDNIVYFDNITFSPAGSGGEPGDGPSAAAPTPPARSASDVISIFSNAYTNVEATDFNPGWGQTTVVTTPSIQGNATLKYANFNYQGTQFGTPQDVSGMDMLNVDMWTEDATAVNVFLVSGNGVETAYSLPITPNQWVSYDIALTAFAGVNLSDVIQFKFDGGNGEQTIYLDNLYFYKDGAVTGATPRSPIDFEADGYGADWTWTVFENSGNAPLEIIANPDPTGINTSATVAKFTALQTGAPWAGVGSSHGDADLGPFVLDETNSTISIMVWKSVISDVGIKLIASTGWAQAEIKVANTKVNEWEELTFDFSGYQNPPAAEGMLDQIAIFPDFNARTQDNIVYFDNITFSGTGGGGTDPTPDGPTVAAPTPTYSQADVISLFSSAYNDVTVDTWRTGWSAANYSEVDIDGTPVKRYGSLDFVGIETVENQINASGMTNFHINVYSDDFTYFAVKLVDFGPDGAFGGGDDTEHEIQFDDLPKGEWVTIDIPLSDFTGLTRKSNLAQYILVARPTGSATVYVDNMFFYDIEGTSIEDGNTLPQEMVLGQNYPNPFNPTTNIAYSIPQSSEVTLEVFNMQGQRISTLVSGYQSAGSHTVTFDASNLASGMYMYRLTSGGMVQVNKMTLIK